MDRVDFFFLHILYDDDDDDFVGFMSLRALGK